MLRPKWNQHDRKGAAMKKESIIIFTLALLISAAIVGTLSYFHYKSNLKQTSPATAEQSRTDSSKPPGPIPNTPPPSGISRQTRKAPATQRLIYPQKCIDANGNITITDQPDCKDAAPTNNLSIVDSVSPKPRQRKPQNQSQSKTQKTNDKRAKKPSLQLGAVSPPRDTPQECKFPMGKALEIERSLSAAKDPAKSIWRKSYCRWIREARQDGCEISREYFYYSHLCSGYG